jgi:hypothetical protein
MNVIEPRPSRSRSVDSISGSIDALPFASQASFERAIRLWEDPQRRAEPPYFGWLSVVLPGYPNTLELAMHVHSREVGVRPSFELEHTDHPLAVEQRQGITLARV